MMPIGWNQIRQTRVSELPRHNVPYGHGQHPQMMQNQQQYDMYHQPPMVQHHQMFPQQMMGNYGMQNPQMMLGNQPKPPEPDGPPPPSPPAPLPLGDAVPPPPPDDGQWWVAEMKNLPSNQHRHELERMVGEKWFLTMTTSQQIECWQHKLQLINKQKKEILGNEIKSKPLPVVSAPTVSAPPRLKPHQPPPQSGNVGQDLQKARDEEATIKQQIVTFQRQYGEWRKQFEDWKDKHKSHPNKDQFIQYETQWMTWQKQMSDQKNGYETSLKAIQIRIQNLERPEVGMQSTEDFSSEQTNAQGYRGSMEGAFPNQQPNRFLGDHQAQGQNLDNVDQFRPGFHAGQRPRFDGDHTQGQRQRFPRSQFDDKQAPSFNQRPRFSAPGSIVSNNSVQQRAPSVFNENQNPRFNENQGPRQRFGVPTGAGPRLSEGWQGRYPRPRGPSGPMLRNKFPRLMDEDVEYNDDWNEGEEDYEEENLQQDFYGRNQGMRGPRPRFGPNGASMGNFPGSRQRPPRPGGPGGNAQFRGQRPQFQDSGPRGRFPRPRGPRPQFGNQGDEGNFADDNIPAGNDFYLEEGDGLEKKDKNDDAGKGSRTNDNEWKVSRDMVPLSFGVDKSKKHNKQDCFTFHDAKQSIDDDDEDEDQQEQNCKNLAPEDEEDVKESDELNPENDYSHYETDEYMPPKVKANPPPSRGRGFPSRGLPQRGRGRGEIPSLQGRGRGVIPPLQGRGRGVRPPLQGRGRGMTPPLQGRGRGVMPPLRGRGRGVMVPLRGRGRGVMLPLRGRGRGVMPPLRDRGRDFLDLRLGRDLEFEDDFPFEDVAKSPHLLLKEEERFNVDNIKRLGGHLDLMEDLLPARDFPNRETQEMQIRPRKNVPPKSSSSVTTPTTSVSSEALDTDAIMQKAKELSSLDIKNLLSAVESVKGNGTPKSEDTKPSAIKLESDLEKRQMSSETRKSDELAALIARERHYEQLARGYDEPALRRSGNGQRESERLTEADLIAAGLDPVSLGLREEDLLLQDFLLNPSMGDPIQEQAVREPLLDPLLQESYLERQMLLREIQGMREREEARQKEDDRREQELREALAKPILQTQKIVETIDYSHGLKDERKKESAKEGERGRSPPPRDDFRRSPRQDLAFRGRLYPGFDEERRRLPPISMDERMRIRERQMFHPPGMDERMARERGFFPPHPMDERMMRERGFWRSPPPPRPCSPYDPSSSVVVADDVGEALDKHWQILDRERESMERKRTSMERRRNSLERTRLPREREEERRDRERSLERLRTMERELKERERTLNERERRLKSPPKKSRDLRSRDQWKPEGGRRSRTPPRRRFEEERPSRDRDRRHRSRSPSPRRFRDRSPMYDRRDRSPRGKSPPRRSPIRGRGDFRDRRRFTSPSGDPSRTRSLRPPPPKTMQVQPVCVRVEDLINDLARQKRPKRIVVILRGLPGSGKSHIAKLIWDKESVKGVTPRLLGLDDYFMVENEKFEKDNDTGKIVKRKVHEYEYEAAMEPNYRQSLLKSFKKTLEDGYFNFVIVDAVNDKVSYFSEFWTAAKKCVFEVYVAELTVDVHVCAKRNTHKRELSEIQEIAKGWEEAPHHMIRLDVRQMVQDSEIQEVEMGDVSDDENNGDGKKEKLTPEQLAGIPQSKWELMEANERLDKLDGIKKKRLTSSQQDMAEFLSVTDDYVQRSSAPGKKRVRWADIAERSTQQRLREVGFVVGQTDWNRLVDGSIHADAALNRTKFI